MRQIIKRDILLFATCQRNKIPNRTIKEPMVITKTTSRPSEKLFIDIVEPFPKSHKGNMFILTLQDDLTKCAWAVSMVSHEANTVAYYFVTQFVCLHGLSQTLVTDICQLLKIKRTSTIPYHPQSNRSLERSHRILGNYLRSFVDNDPQNWNAYVPFAMISYNSIVHTATKFQLYQLVYGNELVDPHSLIWDPELQFNYQDYHFEMMKQMQEAHKLVKTELLGSKYKSKDHYHKKTAPLKLVEGDKVLIQEEASKRKLASEWLVIDIQPHSPNVTKLKKNKHVKVHRNLLKQFY